MSGKGLPTKGLVRLLLCSVIMVLFTKEAFAGIPLITDDAGTLGKGRFQVEVFGEYGHDRDERITARTSDFSATLTYGIVDPLDIVISIPYQFWSTEASGSKKNWDGISDLW